MTSKEERRAQYAAKNQRRREKRSHTLYAEQGRDMRRKVGGAFGNESPEVFNKCAEGTAGQRKAEGDLSGSTKEESEEQAHHR